MSQKKPKHDLRNASETFARRLGARLSRNLKKTPRFCIAIYLVSLCVLFAAWLIGFPPSSFLHWMPRILVAVPVFAFAGIVVGSCYQETRNTIVDFERRAEKATKGTTSGIVVAIVIGAAIAGRNEGSRNRRSGPAPIAPGQQPLPEGYIDTEGGPPINPGIPRYKVENKKSGDDAGQLNKASQSQEAWNQLLVPLYQMAFGKQRTEQLDWGLVSAQFRRELDQIASQANDYREGSADPQLLSLIDSEIAYQYLLLSEFAKIAHRVDHPPAELRLEFSETPGEEMIMILLDRYEEDPTSVPKETHDFLDFVLAHLLRQDERVDEFRLLTVRMQERYPTGVFQLPIFDDEVTK